MVLFAALAYAVTQSGRGSGNISNEQASLYAAAITQIGAEAQMGVTRMVLSGTPAASITYGSPGEYYAGAGVALGLNDFCTVGSTCLFSPAGGGVLAPDPPDAAFIGTQHTLGGTDGTYIGPDMMGMATSSGPLAVTGVGTAAGDLILTFQGLKQSVCQALNTGLGISGIPSTGTNNWGTDGIGAAPGQESACFSTPAGAYVYYQVLIAN